jgi:ferritin-like metal-binding protein YciE
MLSSRLKDAREYWLYDCCIADLPAYAGASEQFEVGCYTALVSAATQLGNIDVARLCKQNLEEDRAMAAWVLQQLPAVVSRDAINPATATRHA